MSDNGSVFTCTNHPLLRWFNTKPNGRLCFSGEVPSSNHPTGRPDFGGGFPLMKSLRAYLDGKLPMDTTQDFEPGHIRTFEELAEWVHNQERIQETWAFECDCPTFEGDVALFVKVPNETYEDNCARITLPPTPKDES